MGIIAGIAAGISAITSFIGSVAGTIGPAIGTFAKGVVGVVSRIPEIGGKIGIERMVGFIADIVHAVAGLLGIKSDDPEILGAKASQEGIKTIDEFDHDTEAYIQYLKDEVELDKKSFEQMSAEEKIGCKAVGLSFETKAIEMKIGGITISEESLVTLAKIHMGTDLIIAPEALLEIILDLKKAGVTNLQDVSDYLEGKGENRVKTGEAFRQALGTEAEEQIPKMKDAVRNYEKE